MRISAEAKRATRERLLEVGCRCFLDQGYGATTTRDIAAAAGIAAGTLFNYFPNKQSLAMQILDDALEGAEEQFLENRHGDESVEEDLFAAIAAEIRALAPFRAFVGAVFETAFSPFGQSAVSDAGQRAHERHMEMVGRTLARHGLGDRASFVSLHLYWTLYLGVLAFWSSDPSPEQEQSWSVLDQATRMFVASLNGAQSQAARKENR